MANRDFDDNIHEEERISLVKQYERMLRNKENLFFDHHSFEEIIEHYESQLMLKEAFEVVERALQQYPSSSSFLYKKADFLSQQQNTREAFVWAEKALIYDPGDLRIYLLKSDLYRELNDFDKALEVLQDALNMADVEEITDVLLEIADLYQEWEKPDLFLENLKKVLVKKPRNYEAQSRFIDACTMYERNEDAIKFLTKLTDLDPYAHLTWQHLGNAYANIELYEKAIDAFELSLAIESKNVDCLKDYGTALAELELFEKAIETYNEVLSIDKKDDECIYLIGKCHYKQGNFDKAIFTLQKAINLDKSYHDAWFYLSKSLMQLDRKNAALDAIKTALDYDETNQAFKMEAARISFALGNYENAFYYLNRITENDPSDKELWFEMAENLYLNNEIERAIELLLQVNTEIKETAKWNYFMGVFHFVKGQKNAGSTYFSNALHLDFNLHQFIFKLDPALENNTELIELINLYKFKN